MAAAMLPLLAGCAALPPDMRARTYSLTLAHASSAVLTLADADFVSAPGYGYSAANTIYSGQFENYLSLNYNDPPIVEQPTRTSSLTISGHAEGVVSGARAELTGWAQFEFCGARGYGGAPCRVPVVTCQSASHRLTLQRHELFGVIEVARLLGLKEVRRDTAGVLLSREDGHCNTGSTVEKVISNVVRIDVAATLDFVEQQSLRLFAAEGECFGLREGESAVAK